MTRLESNSHMRLLNPQSCCKAITPDAEMVALRIEGVLNSNPDRSHSCGTASQLCSRDGAGATNGIFPLILSRNFDRRLNLLHVPSNLLPRRTLVVDSPHCPFRRLYSTTNEVEMRRFGETMNRCCLNERRQDSNREERSPTSRELKRRTESVGDDLSSGDHKRLHGHQRRSSPPG